MRVKNWEKWQTYRKDRGTPPWIKVHRNLMSNKEWASLTDAEKGQLVSLWILAADKNGEIPDSPRILRKMCMLDEEPNINKFKELGFLAPHGCQHDVNMTSTWRQHDAPETETETETETEYPLSRASACARVREGNQLPEDSDPCGALPDCIPLDAWKKYKAWRKQKGRHVSIVEEQICFEQLRKLAAAGQDIEAVILQSMSSGWIQGFYPVKGLRTNTNAPRAPTVRDAQVLVRDQTAKRLLARKREKSDAEINTAADTGSIRRLEHKVSDWSNTR